MTAHVVDAEPNESLWAAQLVRESLCVGLPLPQFVAGASRFLLGVSEAS